MTAQLGGELEALGRSHFVELTSNGEDGQWVLVVTRRTGGYSAESFRGTLAEVITRARAGTKPDFRSR